MLTHVIQFYLDGFSNCILWLCGQDQYNVQFRYVIKKSSSGWLISGGNFSLVGLRISGDKRPGCWRQATLGTRLSGGQGGQTDRGRTKTHDTTRASLCQSSGDFRPNCHALLPLIVFCHLLVRAHGGWTWNSPKIAEGKWAICIWKMGYLHFSLEGWGWCHSVILKLCQR